ncbi:MAG: DUF533 domain-containing protein [Paracoccaceae bacterium]
MSFVRTLATLAVGFAAAKGVDKYRQMGGMAGVQKAIKDNPSLAPLEQMMEKMTAGMGGAGGASGLGGLMSALGGMAAQGTEQMTGFWDQLTGTKTATAASEANAKLMIRAMIQAAKADGAISDDERAALEPYLANLSEEERAFVDAELAAPVDPMALARDAGEGAKAQIYAAAATISKGDSAAEKQFLTSLAQGLALGPEERAQIHSAIGIAAP